MRYNTYLIHHIYYHKKEQHHARKNNIVREHQQTSIAGTLRRRRRSRHYIRQTEPAYRECMITKSVNIYMYRTLRRILCVQTTLTKSNPWALRRRTLCTQTTLRNKIGMMGFLYAQTTPRNKVKSMDHVKRTCVCSVEKSMSLTLTTSFGK